MIEVDTEKLRNCSSELLKLSEELTNIYNALYDRIFRITTNTGEWLGDSASAFVNKSKKDAVGIIELKKNINKFADNICSSAINYENMIGKTV